MLASFSALDRYFGVRPTGVTFLREPGGLVELSLGHEDLSFPGLSYADAVSDGPRSRLRHVCAEGDARPAFDHCAILYDENEKIFTFPRGTPGFLYEDRFDSGNLAPRPWPDEELLFEAAVLVSRYRFKAGALPPIRVPNDLPPVYQRDLLELVLTGARPDEGLLFLERAGFLSAYWPEIAALSKVAHSKEFHPEGDVWRHTLETFSHRKTSDFRLSLALLLHDSGKPDARAADGRRFDMHSELGERVARRFLRRLGFPGALEDEVAFLVRNHMLPSALPRIPPGAITETLDNPLFPELLELYRCDELSTFRGPDGYYDACAAYRGYLKRAKNPFRDPGGRLKAAHRRGEPC